MNMNNLELMDYLQASMNMLLEEYKDKRYIILKPNTLFIVVRKLFELTPEVKINKKYRQKVVLKSLKQMTSNGYIESSINWCEYNELISMIDNINLNNVEEEVFMNESKCDYECDTCKCFM